MMLHAYNKSLLFLRVNKMDDFNVYHLGLEALLSALYTKSCYGMHNISVTVFVPLAAQGAYLLSHFRWALIKTLIS